MLLNISLQMEKDHFSGIIVDADNSTGLANKVSRIIIGGSLAV